MSSRLEGIKREAQDRAREYADSRGQAKEITEARNKTLESLKEINSLDDDVMKALETADHSVRNDAKSDFGNRVESAMERTEQGTRETQGRIQESVTESESNRGKLESIAGGSDYGIEGIRGAAGKSEQMAREYSDTGAGLEREAEAARKDVSERKREIDS